MMSHPDFKEHLLQGATSAASSATRSPKILIQHVIKEYPTTPMTLALKDVSFEVNEGEFVCIVGASGCGKSTLLNIIAGLDMPSQGRVLFQGEPITGPASDRVLILQEGALFPWLTVLDNLLFGLKLKKELSSKERLEIAHYYLKLVGLEKFKSAHVHDLSGGMKSRLALIRGLAVNPQVLLMDEPFASLDALTREQIYEDIQTIWEKDKKTIIFVTHNVPEAVCLGDRVILFSNTPGRNVAEFNIPLPRKRDIRSLKVAQYAHDIVETLRQIIVQERGEGDK